MPDLAVALRYQDAHLKIMERAAAVLAALWRAAGPIGDGQVEQWLARAVPIVGAAQVQAAGLGVAYIAAATRSRPTDPIDVRQLVAGLRGGTPLDVVYARPTITVRKALADGHTLADALAIGAERLDSTVRADVQLAGRAGTYEAMRNTPHVVGYRRVTDGKACRLCVLASTQRYSLEHLMPIHNRCGCTVVPIVGLRDPGHVIDERTLSVMKADPKLGTDGHRFTVEEIRGMYARDVVVREHGELGPVLGVRGQQFTDEAHAAA